MRTVADIGPTELVYRAAALFVEDGAHGEPLRLLVRALELDPHHLQAHAILASVLADSGRPAAGAAVLEWALGPDRPFFASEREFLLRERMRYGACLGFTRPWAAGAGVLGDPDVVLEASFDEAAYAAFVAEAVAAPNSPEGAYRAALAVAGFAGGLLAHASGGLEVADEEFRRPERFSRSEVYDAWLAGPWPEGRSAS